MAIDNEVLQGLPTIDTYLNGTTLAGKSAVLVSTLDGQVHATVAEAYFKDVSNLLDYWTLNATISDDPTITREDGTAATPDLSKTLLRPPLAGAANTIDESVKALIELAQGNDPTGTPLTVTDDVIVVDPQTGAKTTQAGTPQAVAVNLRIATAIANIVDQFKAAGFVNAAGQYEMPADVATATAAFKRWRSMTEAGDTLRVATGSVAFTEETLATGAIQYTFSGMRMGVQSLLGADYISRGNSILSDQISKLKDNLDVTKVVLENLTAIQNLHNKIKVGTTVAWKTAFNADRSGTYDFIKQYAGEVWFSVHGTKTLDVTSNERFQLDDRVKVFNDQWNLFAKGVTDANGNKTQQGFFDPINPAPSAPTEVAADFTKLSGLIVKLATQRDALKTQREARVPLVAAGDGSLESQLTQVIDDVGALAGGDAAKFTAWIIDGMNQQDNVQNNKFGAVQRNITAAISGASNLNDTQKEELRQTFVLFEQFYKSASAVLSRIHQIMEKIATNLGR